jgi:hypothetical protein
LGIVYFLAAIPAAAAMGLPPFVAGFFAWAGYTAIAAAMLLIGAPARRWLVNRFGKKLEPNPEKLFWKVWHRWGVPGLGLLAPVTCGPYFAALIAITLGERPARLMFWISLGVIPWCLLFATLTLFGVSIASPRS